jgi:hypothetical protein
MTREPDFVLGGDRYHALEEVRDPLPVEIGIDGASFGQWRILRGARVDEGAVARATRAAGRRRARHADEGQVVLHRRNPRARHVPDHLTDVIDLVLTVGLLAEHDRRALAAADFRGAQGQRHHVEREPERFDVLAAFR